MDDENTLPDDEWYDTDDDSDDDDEWQYSDDEEEDLIRAGLCPECGGELDVCGHGADWFDDDDDDDYVD